MKKLKHHNPHKAENPTRGALRSNMNDFMFDEMRQTPARRKNLLRF
ncbi:MAG: hypothetical protein HQM16_02710 [Deltaproteobacteria bacterium]|nr:hypothetical protein [Deltaproteobacteria bacterium]